MAAIKPQIAQSLVVLDLVDSRIPSVADYCECSILLIISFCLYFVAFNNNRIYRKKTNLLSFVVVINTA